MVEYKPGMQLELWARDTGLFEGFAVFVNGSIVRVIGDQLTHKFPIPMPNKDESIVINFGGRDGGISAIIDLAHPGGPNTLEDQEGVNHGYIIRPAAAPPTPVSTPPVNP